MDPSAQNFLVNLFNSNKVENSMDQNKSFNPNGQSIMSAQNQNFQGQLPLMFNLNQAYVVPPQNPNINKEMSQSILSILQKKEPEKSETSISMSPLPTNESRIQTPINQNATLSSNTEELKKLLQINTTNDNNQSKNISLTSAPPIQEEKRMTMEPIKTNEKPKIQSNPNTPLFGYINPFTSITSNTNENFPPKTEKSDSEHVIDKIQDINKDETNINSQPKKESSNKKSNEFEANTVTSLKNGIVFDLDSGLDNAQPAKEIITVTKIKRNIEKVPGKEIAVNNNYICYISKNKNIRIIHQESGDFRLFKGHEQKIIDIVVFISKNQNKTSLKGVSIDINNTLILWTEDNNKEFKKLLVVKGKNNGSNRFQRVLFHPSNENIFAVSTNTNTILLFDLRKYKESIITEVNAIENEQDIQCISYNSKINDFRFSSDGSVVVAGYEDGHVRFYDINSCSNIHDFVPHNLEPISSVMFVNAKNQSLDLLLITASNQNNEIKLWNINDMSLIQTIILKHTNKTPEFDFNILEYNSQHQVLVMSNVSRLSIMFSHIKNLKSVSHPEPDSYEKDIINNNEDGVDISNVEFEEIKEFKINDPIINYIVDPNIDPLFNNENENVSLYCISSEEIYQYVINMNGDNNLPNKKLTEEKKIMNISQIESKSPIPVEEVKDKSLLSNIEKNHNSNDLLYFLTSSQKEANKNSSNELLKLIKEGSNSSNTIPPKPVQEASNYPSSVVSTPINSHLDTKFETSTTSDIFQTISDLNNTNNLLKIFESNSNTSNPASPKIVDSSRKSSIVSNTISSVEMKTNNSDIICKVDNVKSTNESLNVSQSQLNDELNKLEANLTSKMNEMLTKQNMHYEKLLAYEKKKRLEAEQKNREYITKTIKDDIKHFSSDSIEQAITREIKNNVVPNLTNTINQTINQQLNKQVENAINKNIRKISEKISQNISKPPLSDNFKEAVSDIIKPVVNDTIKDLFTNYLMTDFQKTINYLILQINETIQNEVTKTIKTESMNNMASRSAEFDQIYKQMTSINTQIQNMQQNITMKATPERTNSFTINTPTVIPAAYVNAINTTMATSPIKMNFRNSNSDKNLVGVRSTDNYETISINSSSMNIPNGRKSNEFEYAEIDRLIREEKFEEIFTNILKSDNEEELRYVCSKLNPNKLLIDSSNKYLSQIVIIALIKQLSDNLSLNATWRIEWLRCSFLVLNINDEYIKEICPNILKEASEKMISFTNEVRKVQPQSKIIDDMNTLVGAFLFSLNNSKQ
ncbi:hypothetical protein H8356DRAFT_1743252 [Neocallimastix lanati (nom. inval.)]|nr:hypothetical protein H8356DRAFT_1743252 [Neocallimastix sp. JGI-2020a]